MHGSAPSCVPCPSGHVSAAPAPPDAPLQQAASSALTPRAAGEGSEQPQRSQAAANTTAQPQLAFPEESRTWRGKQRRKAQALPRAAGPRPPSDFPALGPAFLKRKANILRSGLGATAFLVLCAQGSRGEGSGRTPAPTVRDRAADTVWGLGSTAGQARQGSNAAHYPGTTRALGLVTATFC